MILQADIQDRTQSGLQSPLGGFEPPGFPPVGESGHLSTGAQPLKNNTTINNIFFIISL